MVVLMAMGPGPTLKKKNLWMAVSEERADAVKFADQIP